MITGEELKQKHGVFNDTWRFYKKWACHDGNMSHEDWKQLHDEAHFIAEQYDHEKMARAFLLAIVFDIDERNGN